MTDQLPAPLVPAEVDLRDFAFMPLDVTRLFNSRFHAVSNDAEWRAGVTLWCKSWQQVPCGSLPDDDIELCRLAELGRDLKAWRKVRENALHGWVKCSDGRLYHAVVTEKAAEAWAKKRKASEKGKLGNEKRWGKARAGDESAMGQGSGEQSQDNGGSDPQGIAQGVAEGLAQGVAGASHRDRKGQGQGEGIEKNPLTPKGEGRFPDFWAAWPSGERKQDRKKCLAKWQRCSWDKEADAIVAHVLAMKATRQWRDGFEPAPLTYLNGERWRDGVPVSAGAASDIFDGVH